MLYFYDDGGKPTWALGIKPVGQSDTYGLDSYRGFCPHCAYKVTSRMPVGDITLRFADPSKAKLNTGLVLKAPLSGSWQLDNTDIENFTGG